MPIITTLILILLASSLAINPALSLDRIIKLYLCQTEHSLEEITGWEYAYPERYRQATRDGSITPLDAARERAGSLVSSDDIQCDSDNQVVIHEKKKSMKRLSDRELEQYCPRTIKKYGHPCREAK